MKTHLFTPRVDTQSTTRLPMQLSTEDIKKTGRGHWRATVTDQNTAIEYKVRGASCGLPRCMCDAVIID